MDVKQVAIVTGANRGLGLATSRKLGELGFQVVMTGRNIQQLTQAADSLREEGHDVIPMKLDVTDPGDIIALNQFIRTDLKGRVDVLINNAGIHSAKPEPSFDGPSASIFTEDPSDMMRVFDVNTLGPIRCIRAVVPYMLANGYGRIVNVSSGMGGVTEMEGGFPGYRISKAGLNAVTKMFDFELGRKNILVNSVCPGWVRTDMGGPNATLSPEEGIRCIVWAATLGDQGPSGGFFRDMEPIPF